MAAGTVPRMELSFSFSSRSSFRAVMPDGNVPVSLLRDRSTTSKSFILENKAGAPTLISRRRLTEEHQIEVVGEKLRAMMPWIKANKLVDKSRN